MRKRLLFVTVLCCILGRYSHSADYYPISAVTVDTIDSDLYPVENLIQGVGVGIAADEPHELILGGSAGLWVTAADAGFPADYIEEVGQPVIQFDLGEERTLKEISVWGYAGTNSNGTSQFSLRFATEAEGTAEGIDGPIDYGTSISYNPTFDLFLDPTPQQYKLFSEAVTARYVEFTNVDNFFIVGNADSLPEEPVLERLIPMVPGGDRVGLGEVAFMDLPESFQPGDKLVASINGTDYGTLVVETTTTNQTISELGPQAGLAQLWYDGNITDPEVFLFDLEGSESLRNPGGDPIATLGTWWAGPADFSENGRIVPPYPRELEDTRFAISKSANNYAVKMTGEVFIEENGDMVFRDGIEDFAMIAVDLDGNGELDELEDLIAADVGMGAEFGDVLTLDATAAGRAGGDNEVFANFENVPEGGAWRMIEVWVSEGGGNDGAAVYMGKADDPDIWDSADPLTQEQIDKFYLGNDRLRTDSAVIVSYADSIGTIPIKDSHEYILQVGADGNDEIVALDAAIGDGLNLLDVSGATIRIAVEGEVEAGTEFAVFRADEVIGIDSLTLVFDDASMWDTSKLSQGILTFGAGSCNPNSDGDLDGNGRVEFADFLVLSGNFGQAVADHTLGDIDCNGTVEFADFLTLSGNFGKAVGGAESVPEPSGLVLFGLSTLLLGCFRRRR